MRVCGMMEPSHEAAQRALLRECFALADTRQRGFLDLRDLKCAVAAALGIRASKLVLAQMFSHVLGANAEAIEDICVPQDAFVAALLPRLRKTDLLELVRRDFKAFDLRSQGFISLPSFEAACSSVVPHMSQKTIYEIFREADRDGDGRVTYNDFETIYLIGAHATTLSHPRTHAPPPSGLPRRRSRHPTK